MSLPKSMYEPVAYSPVTAISAAIGASDTTITVDDGALLGDAPNIAVIGESADISETIVYGTKNGNILTNVQRGIQGTAQVWTVGDPIARNFTALDQSNIQDNINALDAGKVNKSGDTMTGTLTLNSQDVKPLILSRNVSMADIVQDEVSLKIRKFGGLLPTNYLRSEFYLDAPLIGGAVNANTIRLQTYNETNAVIGTYNIWGGHNFPFQSGSWTPSIYQNNSPAPIGLNVTYSDYNRIGNMVYIESSFTVASNTAPDIMIELGNFPFIAYRWWNMSGMNFYCQVGTPINGKTRMIPIFTNTNRVRLLSTNFTASGVLASGSYLPVGIQVDLAGWYRIS